jgi:RimJ/RimL family protein N-acetyltransferase
VIKLYEKFYGELELKFPELETSRLKLTKLINEDAKSIFELFSDELVIKYYDLEALTELSQAENLIKFFQSRFDENTGIRWSIHLKETNQFVGTCGFNSWNIKMKNAVIGYDLISSLWGKGIATEAVNRIVKSAFLGELPCRELNRIQGDTVPGNTASEAVMLKIGFKEEGLRRESGYWKNQFHDLKCFGLIRSE